MPSTAPHRPAAPPAPGVTRLGDPEVNFYLLEDPDGLVLIDGGLPGHLPQLRSYLEGADRSLGDIRALLLTHAHPDHQGSSHAICERLGIPLWCGQGDIPAMETPGGIKNSQAPGWLNRFQARFWTGPPHPVARALAEGADEG